ncbi:MAG: PKD domain-containing protein, partial [Bacteroidota bacterium]
VVNSAPPPLSFTLYQPNNKSTTADHNISFAWNQAINAISYTLQYSIDSTFSSGVVSIDGIVNTYHQLTIFNENKYFWRVIAKGICGDETYSAVFSFSIFSPLSANGLTLWLRADAGVSLSGNKVTGWNDGSGNNYHAQQSNVNLQPSLITDVPLLNHKPAINFDGINDLLNGVTIPNLQNSSLSIFVVAKGEAQGGVVAGIFDINSYSNGFSFGRYTYSGHGTLSIWNNNSLVETPTGSLPSSGFNYKMLAGIKNFGTMTDLLINTVTQISSPNIGLNDVFTNGNYDIGYATGLDYFKGNIAEVVLFNTSLANPERKSIENYLSYKYAPPVNLGPDINIAYGLCDTALNAGGRFINYLWSTGDTTQAITVAQSGIYSVTVTNIFGQLSSDTVIVTKPDVVMNDTSFCLGDTIHIAANMSAGYSYQWLPGSFSSNHLTVFNPGLYSLTVFDTSANHCSVTKTFTVTADSFAIVASLGPDKKICKGDYIGLINGAQQAVSYLWSDGSGNSLIIINDAMGSQPVYSVTVSSGNGCVAHDTIQLTVNGVNPIASFASDTVCSGNTSHFFDHSIVDPPFQITSYNWNFGDGSFSMLPNPVHLFVDDGYYPVQLTITTDSGCVNSVLDTAKVFSKPHVNFLPYQGCSGVPIAFTDKTQCYIGTLTHWNWTFNDIHNVGFDTSSFQNPHYIFDSAGIYTVKIVASSNAGCVDSVEKTVTIKRSPPIDFSITTACAEHSVFFHDLIGLEPWETIISYHWQFGDGNSSIISNPNHIFDTAGIYNTEFTVKTSTGCEVSITKPIDVGGMPTVDFLYGNNCIQNTTLFTDNSLINNGSITSWHWKFGGLGSDTHQNPSFIFPDTATYNVSLAIMTDHNCVDSVSHPVKIVAAPTAQFSVSPEYGVPPLPVSMSNSSVGATTYLWTFGDSESSTLTNPVHTYQNQGIFSVLLSAFNDIGCRDTISHKVYVLPTKVDIAVVGAQVTKNNGRISVAADLSNEGTRKIEHIDMAVDFGNGNILHEQWLGALLEGEGLHYEFAVSTDIPSNADVNFVCVEASLPDLTEDSIANNIFCVAMKDEFLMPEMYPNPVKDVINIAFILPFEDQVTIDVVNSMGSFIREIYNGNGKEGYNRLTTDVSTLNNGVYTVRIYFRDKILRKKFVKL